MTTTFHTYFGYRDAQAAIDWLGSAFGFEPTMVVPDDDGAIMHSELRRGDAVIMVFTDRAGYEKAPRKGESAGTGTYLAVDDPAEVDAAYERAMAAGATSVWEPHTTEWNSHRIRVLDPEGYEWTFGTHRPGD